MLVEIAAIITAGLLIHYLTFLLWIRGGLIRLLPFRSTAQPIHPSITVIIPFRNEADNLERNIISLSAQRYNGGFKIVYVNDHSTDNSCEIIEKYLSSGRIELIHSRNGTGKKAAIKRGIENSQSEIIVCSDADCTYAPRWLETMISAFTEKTGFVAGPVMFESSKKFFVNMQRLEFAGLTLAGSGLIGRGMPLICNGANIAYRRELFDQVGGFYSTTDLASGDDELLMRKIHQKTNYEVTFCGSPDALVTTRPSHTPSEFFIQRQRWASKGLHYPSYYVWLYLVPMFVLFFIMISMITAAVFTLNTHLIASAAVMLALKAAAEYTVLRFSNAVFRIQINFFVFVVSELVHPYYIIIASLLGAFFTYRWKSRSDLR